MMQRSKAVAVMFYLGAMLIGAVVGIAADRQLVDTRIQQAQQRDTARVRETFAQRLSLTPEQEAAADSIFGNARRAVSALMAPIRPIQDSITVAARAEFRTRLTPEQQVVYDQMTQRRGRNGDGRR